jgi:hypothetical protein
MKQRPNSLASLIAKIKLFRDECDAKAKDIVRRPGKRAVYGHVASHLTELLKPFEEQKHK